MNNEIVPFIGKVANGVSKYYLVKITGHNKCNVANIMDLSTGKILTKTLWNTGKVVHHLSINPKRVSKTLKLATSLIK